MSTPTSPLFGFGGPRDLPGPSITGPEPEPEPEAARAEPPKRGTVVRWLETDPYDELAPQKVRYGVVVEHSPEGAALVLQLGEIRNAAHFGPGAALTDQDPVVSNLQLVG